jgi:hypothetical protein
MTEMRQKCSESSTDKRTGTPHPPPKLLLPFLQHPNPLISTQIKINQGNSRIFKDIQRYSKIFKDIQSKKQWRLLRSPLLLPISLNRHLPIGYVQAMLELPLRDSRLFAPIRTYSR